MTQFAPPQPPPYPGAYPQSYDTPRPWSASAISGFVLSLLGCFGVTAIAGLVLGIVGIVRTHGGQRRGMGLAIAAIPISLVTGALFIPCAAIVVLSFAAQKLATEVGPVLEGAAGTEDKAVVALRKLGSESFLQDVPEPQIRQWFQVVASKHGKLVRGNGSVLDSLNVNQCGAEKVCIDFTGSFVNGKAPVKITLVQQGFFKLRIDDIEVDGLSPRAERFLNAPPNVPESIPPPKPNTEP